MRLTTAHVEISLTLEIFLSLQVQGVVFPFDHLWSALCGWIPLWLCCFAWHVDTLVVSNAWDLKIGRLFFFESKESILVRKSALQ